MLLDGRAISKEIQQNLILEVESLNEDNIYLTLAVIIVGDDVASQIYVKNKKNMCQKIGIKSIIIQLDEYVQEDVLIWHIQKLNSDRTINGILVQFPLPEHIDSFKILTKIDPTKDVDGFHPFNVGLLSYNKALLEACTPKGIITLLQFYDISLEGKHCVILGRSNIVGKPLFHMLLNKNASVTVLHSKSNSIKEIIRSADILISATGQMNIIKQDMLKEDVVLVDVGICRMGNKIFGDVDFEDCVQKASYITPVPGGVGPMTITMLLLNCILATKLQNDMLN